MNAPTLVYRCRCGYEFPETLGKYGCPNCCGESGAARLVEKKCAPRAFSACV